MFYSSPRCAGDDGSACPPAAARREPHTRCPALRRAACACARTDRARHRSRPRTRRAPSGQYHLLPSRRPMLSQAGAPRDNRHRARAQQGSARAHRLFENRLQRSSRPISRMHVKSLRGFRQPKGTGDIGWSNNGRSANNPVSTSQYPPSPLAGGPLWLAKPPGDFTSYPRVQSSAASRPVFCREHPWSMQKSTIASRRSLQ